MINIAIIGAGPVGSYTAYLLSKQGFNVSLFDSKKSSQIGCPIQCTGLLTSGIKKFIPLSKDFLLNTFSSIQIFAPNQHKITVNKTEYLVDRKKFDQHILDLALKQGVTFHPQHKLIGIKESTLIFKHGNKTKKVSPDIIIGADGPSSLVYRCLNPFKKKTFYYGVQAVIKGNFNPNAYQTFFGSKICPDLFAWLVPQSKTKARVGLAALDNPSINFTNFLKRLGVKQNQIIERQGGIIPLFDPKLKTKAKNIFLIGDAASHVKATTLGGIVPGFKAAINLTYQLTNMFCRGGTHQNEVPSVVGRTRLFSRRLNNYPFKNHQNLKLHLRIRETLNKFSDKDYNKLICLSSQPRIKKIIETHSRENPGKLIKKILLKEPRLLSFVKYLF